MYAHIALDQPLEDRKRFWLLLTLRWIELCPSSLFAQPVCRVRAIAEHIARLRSVHRLIGLQNALHVPGSWVCVVHGARVIATLVCIIKRNIIVLKVKVTKAKVSRLKERKVKVNTASG